MPPHPDDMDGLDDYDRALVADTDYSRPVLRSEGRQLGRRKLNAQTLFALHHHGFIIMAIIMFTFIITTAAYVVLLGFGLRRVLSHLRNNTEGMAAVTKHVLIPLFGDSKPQTKGDDT